MCPNPRIEVDLALCVKYEVSLIMTSLGAISELVNSGHSLWGLGVSSYQ